MDSYENRQQHSGAIEPMLVQIKSRLYFPSLLRIFGYLLAAIAIVYLLLSASRVIETTQLFLFTSPSAPGADGRIDIALRTTAVTLIWAFIIFVVTGLTALVCNRIYFRATLQGIALSITAYSCWLIAAIGLVFWTKAKKMPEIPMIYSILAALAGFGMIKQGSTIFLSAKQHMVRLADDIFARSRAAPVLYLRSFSTDSAAPPAYYAIESREHRLLTWRVLNPSFWTEKRNWTFEEVLCKGFSSITPVVAVGQPGERLPKLGAARKYVSQSEWQQEVQRLLNTCRFCCLVVGHTRGLLWEFKQAIAQCSPEKILLAVPPLCDGIWQTFVQAVKTEQMNITLPLRLPESTLVVSFTKGFNPIIVTGRSKVNNYREIALCIIEGKWTGLAP